MTPPGKTNDSPPMPRQPRLDAPGALHHGMGRGIERTQIFTTDGDRRSGGCSVTSRCGEWGIRGQAVMRFLGVTRAASNRLAASDDLPQTRQYLNAL